MNEELVLLSNDAGTVYIDPRTGVEIGPAASDDDLVSFLAFLKEARDRIGNAERIAGGILLDRMDARRSWTVGPASAPSPTAGGEWDEATLRIVLQAMVAAGRLDAAAATRCFQTKTTVVAAGVKAVLAGSTPEDQHAILGCQKPRTSPRRVTVKP